MIKVMKKKKQSTTISKIDFDEKTKEPIIVEVEHDEQIKKTVEHVEKHPVYKAEKAKEVSKQLMMSRLPGFDKDSEKIDKKQRLFKRLFTVVFVVFVLTVLIVTFYNDFFVSGRKPVSFATLLGILADNWKFLVYALLALFGCYLTKGLKLAIMCKSVTGKFHFKTCMETGIVGHYYNSVTPLGAGGQPFEIYHLAKHGIGGGAAASLPIATFTLNQLIFVGLSLISFILFQNNVLDIPPSLLTVFPQTFNVFAIIGLVCSFLMPSLVFIFSILPRVGTRLVHFVMWVGSKLRLVKNPKETTYKTVKSVVNNAKCLKKFASKPLAFIPCIILSVCEWAALCSLAYFSLKFFGYDIANVGNFLEWLQVSQLCLILYAAISFIPTPGNSGAADGFFYVLFQVELFAGLAFSAMFLWRLLSFYSFIIVGFIFTTFKRKADRKRAEQAVAASMEGETYGENNSANSDELE